MNQFLTAVTGPEGRWPTYLSRRPRADVANPPAHPLAVFEACRDAGRKDLAAELIIQRATQEEVETRLAAEGAAAPAPAPASPSPAAAATALPVTPAQPAPLASAPLDPRA